MSSTMTVPEIPVSARGSLTHLPNASAAEAWHEVKHATRGHRVTLLAVVVLGLLSASLGLVMPAALGWLVDGVTRGGATPATVLLVAGVMACATTAAALCMALTVRLATRVYETVLADLRERLVARTMALPQDVVERAGTGDLIARTSDDVAKIADGAPQIIPALTGAFFVIVVTVGGMSTLDWRYGVLLLALVPVYVLAVRWYLSTAPRVYQAERSAMSGRAQHLLESLRGSETVRGFGLGEQRHRTVVNASWTVVGHTLRASTVQNMFLARMHLAEFLGMTGILLIGFWLIGTGHSTIGSATTAMLLFLRLFGPINQLLFVIDELQSALASLTRIVGVIVIPTTGPAERGYEGAAAREERTEVRLTNVTFDYPNGHRALDRLDLTIATGEHLAVVGASGAGKTTLAGVIAGIHTPQLGSVVVVPDLALITQDTHVFEGSLRENLTLAAPGADDEEIAAALHAVGAGALPELLPHGLDSIVGTTGHPLTTAQTQQLAIARVILADPELAVFDEATAEAGSAQSHVLDQAAEAALTGRTALVIAHRLSQAAACDRIIVMDHGRIAESGTHSDLLDQNGIYARLWSAWESSREIVASSAGKQ